MAELIVVEEEEEGVNRAEEYLLLCIEMTREMLSKEADSHNSDIYLAAASCICLVLAYLRTRHILSSKLAIGEATTEAIHTMQICESS